MMVGAAAQPAESADPRTTCATRKRMPVYYEEDLNDSDYETPGDNDYATADPRNNFETVNGMPVYYGGDLNDSDYESPGDNDYDTWEDWCDSDIRDRYCGFLPDDEEAQLPVIFGAPMFRGEGMGEPLRVRPDSWSATGSVVLANPVTVLSPETVRGKEIVFHQLEKKWRTNTS